MTATPAMISLPTPFRLSFDISTEGYDNVWDAVGATLAESVQPSDAIVSAKYTGLAPNGWPTVQITFASVECAKAFTYAYLGYTLGEGSRAWDVYTDGEVGEYIQTGEFVEG
jgi:hypothetical protein